MLILPSVVSNQTGRDPLPLSEYISTAARGWRPLEPLSNCSDSWGKLEAGGGAGVRERGGEERGTHLPQDPGPKLSPHLWSVRDDLRSTLRSPKPIFDSVSAPSLSGLIDLLDFITFWGEARCIYVCPSLKLAHRQGLVSKPVPLFLQVRERGSLTSVSSHCKQRPSWLPVSSKCSLSKKFSGQWLKWHHASSWNPTRDKNQVIQFTTRKCSLLLPAFRGCWLLKRSRKRRAYLNSGFENVSWTTCA